MDGAIERFRPVLERISSLEAACTRLSDTELRAKTEEFRKRAAAGETLADLLPEAFAVVRETARRTIGLRHRDEQILGGLALHEGRIAQMETGEGKTLTATAPAYLNAISGRGVHVVTPTEYLAYRDGKLVSPIYTFLGIVSGTFQEGMNETESREAWGWDITYTAARGLGFEYLRDALATSSGLRRMRGRHYAIIDELDAVLIDEARTPFIVTGAAEIAPDQGLRAARLARELSVCIVGGRQRAAPINPDAVVNPRTRTVELTENGTVKCARMIPSPRSEAETQSFLSAVCAALSAVYLHSRGSEYDVSNGELYPLSNGTRDRRARFSAHVQAALEAKEGLETGAEDQTLATITVQEIFRGYRKLSGMTATASAEAEELKSVYDLEVAEIPPHYRCVRKDYPDRVYRTAAAKRKGILDEIEESWSRGRPVIVATRFSEEAAALAAELKTAGISCDMLMGRGFDIRDADIIAKAGRPGGVTIVPEGAGLGIHIELGGLRATAGDRERVRSLGGIHLIGCERGLSRRTEDQLRGRVARLGEPGSARFFVSLEDDLCRLAGDLEKTLGAELAGDRGVADSDALSGVITEAQRKIQRQQRDVRGQLIDFETPVRGLMQAIHTLRDTISDPAFRGRLAELTSEDIRDRLDIWMAAKEEPTEWDLRSLAASVGRVYKISLRPPAGALSRLDRLALERDLLAHSASVVEEQWRRLEYLEDAEAVRLALTSVANRLGKEFLHEVDRAKKGAIVEKGEVDRRKRFEEEVRRAYADLWRQARGSLLETFVHFRSAE